MELMHLLFIYLFSVCVHVCIMCVCVFWIWDVCPRTVLIGVDFAVTCWH